MNSQANLEDISKRIVDSGAIEIRNVDSGQEPFVYSTGNRGPGYLMIKGLVGQRGLLKFLTRQLAIKIAPLYGKAFDFVEGNATGGMVPAWQLADDLERVLGLEEGSIPYCYLRGSRKGGGHGELITGNRNNPFITEGMGALVFEELVNYAGTTGNAAEEFRAAGYSVSHASCILSYDNPQANQRLADLDVTLVPLITLPQLLDCAEREKLIDAGAVRSYQSFLADPLGWQLDRDMVVPTGSANLAMSRGQEMRKLERAEALKMGAPQSKVGEGVDYWAQLK